MTDTQTIQFAQNIEKKYGTNYYIATLFFPKEIREAVFLLYAFVRIPDEYVDNPKPGTNPEEEILNWKKAWQDAYTTHTSKNPLLTATAQLFIRYNIPFDLSITFIDAMIRDLSQSRYDTYTDLQSYMHGSAEVVGLMLTYIIGYTDKKAFEYACKLGEAMQFTNFLRDIHEDYIERGRIYIPKEDMDAFGVTETMLREKTVSPEFIALMKYEIKKAHLLFKEAELGISMLSHKGQFPVRLASRLYEKILTKIEQAHYDIFTKRASVTLPEKIFTTLKTYV